MYVYIPIGNTTDIKLADFFSRAVNFFLDKVTRLAGWQVVLFFFFSKIKIKINMHAGVHTTLCILRYLHHRYHSLLCRLFFSFIFHSLNKVDTRNSYRVLPDRQKNYNLLATHLGFFFSLKALKPILKFSPSFNALPYRLSVL